MRAPRAAAAPHSTLDHPEHQDPRPEEAPRSGSTGGGPISKCTANAGQCKCNLSKCKCNLGLAYANAISLPLATAYAAMEDANASANGSATALAVATLAVHFHFLPLHFAAPHDQRQVQNVPPLSHRSQTRRDLMYAPNVVAYELPRGSVLEPIQPS